MELPNVLFEVVLSLVMDPLLEVVEIEHVGVRDMLCVEPLDKEWEVVSHLFSVEDSVDHMTTEESQLYLVAGVRMNFLILMDGLEDMRGRRPVCELQLLERIL